jgi:succinate dehydrogenase / fumarate reductase, membrane anchor subunit
MMAQSSGKVFRAPLKGARGLGSAKEGVGHWWAQRLTALALVPLVLWLVVGVIAHLGATQGVMVSWLRSPVTATLMILLIAAGVHHGQAGMQVVYEDYIHHEGARLTAIVATKLLAFAVGAAAIVAVLKLSFGA